MTKWEKYLAEKIEPHIGHVVKYRKRIGEASLSGKFLRMVKRPDLHAAEIWIELEESNSFDDRIFDDQIIGCECQEASYVKGNG